MNNYLSLNLVSGRLSRYSGGSRPSFIVGEQNNTQIYILDFFKPITYPSNALGDAFAYSIESQDYNSSNLTLKAGVRGSNAIISQSSFSSLPNNINTTTSINYRLASGQYLTSRTLIVSGSFSFSSIATQTSLYSISLTNTYNFQGIPPSFTGISPFISFNSSISNIDQILRTIISQATYGYAIVNSNIFQSSDFSYNFSYEMNANGIPPLPTSSSLSINTSQMNSNYGKYGFLDFTSPQWNTILGNKNEKEIWLEAMINGQTISQGIALINKKMS